MSYVNYKPMASYSLSEVISSGKRIELSHSNFQFKTKHNDTIHSFDSLYAKYHNVLNPYIIDRELDEDEYMKYYQKPKLLSYELYDTPELWSGLLYINNMVSVSNFTKKKIKVFKSNILDIMQEIMTIYNQDINNNKKEIYNKD